MLKLHRVRLVHWHYYEDTIIPFGTITLFAGDNASGKSTVIDAVQYALVADIRKVKFNTAASGNRGSSRTLESYCRCKLGMEGREYKRQDTITHVILEFNSDDSFFCAGICVEAFENQDVRDMPWIIEDCSLDNLPVDNGKEYFSQKEFREHVKGLNGTVCPTKVDYNSRLTMLLGVHRRAVLFNPYLETLLRSVTFTPLQSVGEFVREYILEERQVDVSKMKDNLDNYRQAENEARAIEVKIAKLREIEKGQSEFEQIAKQIRYQEYLLLRARVLLRSYRLRELKEEVSEYSRKLKNLVQKIEALAKEKDSLQKYIDDLRVSLARNDEYLLLESLKKEEERIKEEREETRKKVERFSLLYKQCEAFLGRKLSVNIEDEFEQLNEKILLLGEERARVVSEITQVMRTLKEDRNELQELERGILKHPKETEDLKLELVSRGIECWIFSDQLEVRDVKWQNAVEGWLNTQRHNIIVDGRDFQKAIEVYNSLDKKIAGVGLPNLDRIKHSRVLPASLAEIVESDNPLASRYVAHLLGTVIRTGIEKLKEYDRAVTVDCMRYSAHTASRIKEQVYSRWYIGTEARTRRKSALKQAITDAERQLDVLERERRETDMQIANSNKLVQSLSEIIPLQGAGVRLENLDKERAQIKKRIDSVDISSIKKTENALSEAGEKVKAVGSEQLEANENKGRLSEKLNICEQRIMQTEAEEKELVDLFQQYMSQSPDDPEDLDTYYLQRIKDAKNSRAVETLLGNFEANKKTLEGRISNVEKALVDKKNRYNSENRTLYDANEQSSAEFISLLRRYVDTELPSYRERIHKAREEAELQFREHFVSRMNEYINDARDSFSEINHALSEVHFGNDQYGFTLHEHPDKRRVLEVIRNASKVENYRNTLFDALVNEEDRRSIEKLFQSILENDLDSPEVREICDYRRYFHYDIKIRHTDTGMESLLSRVLKEKSGGETQTPYYVALGASFYRFFKDDENAVRLAMFDEAFNKMDESRIGTTVDFFRRLGMQMVTAVPTEKMEYIAPYCDKVNLVIRKGFETDIRDFSRDIHD